MPTPEESTWGNLARQGFFDTDRAQKLLGEVGDVAKPLIPLIARSADPDLALASLVDLADAANDRDDLLREAADDEGSSMRLLSVLGASQALGEHLRKHPDHWHELRDPTLGSTRPAAYAVREGLLRAVGSDPADAEPVSTMEYAEAMDALRVEYRRVLLRLAARDLAHHLGLDDAAAELADLAAGTLDAALAIARAKVGDDYRICRLAVIAMGKCGGHELNYVSDVDVIFVAEPAQQNGSPEDERQALRAATQLASTLMQVCSENTAEGTIWPVDANLRPEGKSGPLVRTIASHCGYYERWAKTWEFQALLKARPVAGDMELGRQYDEVIKPMVWSAAEREGFVEEVQSMRRRVLDHIPADRAERQLKLGSGGLRDVEFAVQLLQMVHGRTDEEVRAPTTLSALAALTERGYVGREDGRSLHDAYAFLRTLEHRIQLYQLRRTHVVPEEEAALRRLGRSLGYRKDPVRRAGQAVAVPPARGAPAAREAVLPPTAFRGGQGGRRSTAQPRGRQGATGCPRLPRPQGCAPPPRGAHHRCHTHGADPAHPAAGHARVVRGRTRPGRRSVRLPEDLGGPGCHTVVPPVAA